jgi:hypothetical protein
MANLNVGNETRIAIIASTCVRSENLKVEHGNYDTAHTYFYIIKFMR